MGTEEETKVKVKVLCEYDGFAVKGNHTFEAKFKIPHSELMNSIKFALLLERRFKLRATINQETNADLGEFSINKLSFSNDRECTLHLRTALDFANVESFTELLVEDATIELKAVEVL